MLINTPSSILNINRKIVKLKYFLNFIKKIVGNVKYAHFDIFSNLRNFYFKKIILL